MARVRVMKINEHIPTTWEETLEQFLSWKKAQGLSKQTLEDYKRHVGQFYKRYPDAFGCQQQHLGHLLCDYLADKIKPATYNNRLVYLRADNAKTRVSRTLNISPQTAKAISDLIAHQSKE